MTLEQFQKAFGARVRNRREELELSKAELAKRMGIQTTHVTQTENGLRNTTLDYIRRFADALQVEPGYFFEF